jgi:site-specific DNA recombinase
VDRFARSLKELLVAEALMTSLGVDHQSATEPFDTSTPMGRFMFQLLGGVAELEKNVILERTGAGKDRVAKNGQWPGGPPAYGYRITDRQLDLDPQEAPIIRELYERIVAGSILVQEAKKLNDAGVPTRTGRRWTPSTIGKLLHTPTYRGEMCYHCATGNMTLSLPQIVSPELWKTAPGQLRVNSTRQETKHHALLRGKISVGIAAHPIP